MQFRQKYLIIFFLFSATFLHNAVVFSQAELVFSSHTAYVNLSNGSAATPIYLVIGNPAANGITGASAANGWIISEGQYNCVDWKNAAAGTSYLIPFGYSHTDYLPFTLNKSAGAATDLVASTWYNSNANMSTGTGVPAATDVGAVTNLEMALNSSATTWGGYVNVIDRFWVINTTATAILSFTYRGSAASENANSITSNLVIQHWNSSGCWDGGNTSCSCTTTTDCFTSTGTNGSIGGSDYTVTGSTSCNEFSPYILASSTNPLPIELLSFNAACDGNSVSINWQTASETNNNYFTIERSNDGATWETLATVPGAGNSNTTLSYSYTDNNSFQGTSYYRLKQTDFNGQSKTFSPVIVNCSDANSENTGITRIYPNPATNEVYVEISCMENTNGQLIVHNTIGQKIIKRQLELLKGTNVYTIDISDFAVGIYPVTFNNEQGETWTKKIIKTK